MTDSGIFSKRGCTIDYEELFRRYDLMGTDFGIMIDVLRDSKATLKNAQKALKLYEKNKKKYKFRLVAVAQGNTLEEYLECYSKLSNKFEFIAVGGLLKKLENTARYVKVRNEDFLYIVLESIMNEFKPRWLFALGCYHPSRHKRFEEIGVWGSDYKGWIFNYVQKRKIISSISKELACMESKGSFSLPRNELIEKVKKLETDLLKQEHEWRKERNSSLKALFWNKINQLKVKLEIANKKLLAERELLVKNDNLPLEYKDKLKYLREIIELSEQAFRFQQVQRYIEENVYVQLQ